MTQPRTASLRPAPRRKARVHPPAVPPFDPEALRRAHGAIDPVLRWYFRSEVRGLDRIPDEPTLVVTHHDGGMVPYNGLCFGAAWHQHYGFKRPLHVLTHDLFHMLPWGISQKLAGLGMMRADRAAMDAALSTGSSVLVFPGAARESFRPTWERKRIDLGGRSGFVAQAIRWKLPITPVVSAGGHETHLILARGDAFARRLGLPKIVRSADIWPIQAGLPWGLWAIPCLPALPLPARITTEVLAPIWLPKALGRKLHPRDAEDPDIVHQGFTVVLDAMRAGIAALYAQRHFAVLG